MEGREREIRKVALWGTAVNITLTIVKLLVGVFGHGKFETMTNRIISVILIVVGAQLM